MLPEPSLCSKFKGWIAPGTASGHGQKPYSFTLKPLLHQGLPCSAVGALERRQMLLQEPLILCPSAQAESRAIKEFVKVLMLAFGKPVSIQAPFLVILSLFTSTIHSCILFPRARAVWMDLAGIIHIVPLGFFSPQSEGRTALQPPNNPHPAASPFLDYSQVAHAEIWWCPTPIPGVCQTSPFSGREERQKSRERKHWLGLKQFLTLPWCFMCSVLSVSCNVCWPLLTDLLFMSAADCC